MGRYISGSIGTSGGAGATTEQLATKVSLDGAEAVGVWPISVTGNAASAATVPFDGILNRPTTIAGYGITDAGSVETVDFSNVTNTPTTIAGFGITDAVSTEVLSQTVSQAVSNVAASSLEIEVNNTSSVTAVAGMHYVLTSGDATTVTLPANPLSGNTVWINVSNGLLNNVINPNGQTIMGSVENLTIDLINLTVELRFINNDWKLI